MEPRREFEPRLEQQGIRQIEALLADSGEDGGEQSPRSPAPPLSPALGGAKAEKDKDKDRSKWGFLKKMSMARIRPEGSPPQARPATATATSQQGQIPLPSGPPKTNRSGAKPSESAGQALKKGWGA